MACWRTFGGHAGPLGGNLASVTVFQIDAGTGERLGLLATAKVGEGGWVDQAKPILVRADEAFFAVPEPGGDESC